MKEPCARRINPVLAAFAACLVALLGCAGADTESAPQAGNAVPPSPFEDRPIPTPPTCEDSDGDGYGRNCAQGNDCDDNNPLVGTTCDACLRPNAGCACVEGSAALPCNLATGTTATGPEGICRLGQRACRDGRWSLCEPFALGASQVVGTVTPCWGQCDPTCNHVVDCYEQTDTLPTGTQYAVIGSLPAAPFCPSGVGAGGVTSECVISADRTYVRGPSPLSWTDACTTPGASLWLTLSDDGVVPVNIPFTFQFYGIPYGMVNVSANGLLSFSSSSVTWNNTILPTANVPNSVFAFWDDLIQRTGVCTVTTGTAPNRRFITQWNNATFFGSLDLTANLTFEAVLSEQTQTIDLLYQTMTGEGLRSSGSSATIGIQEGAGAGFDLVAFNTPRAIRSGDAFRWTPQSSTTRCSTATWKRVFEAACPNPRPETVGTWGIFNYTSLVPNGSSIAWQLRAANTQAGLATAPVIRLPDAPRSTGTTPNTTSLDLGVILHASAPALARARFIELTAVLEPNAVRTTPPTLGSVEVQFNCIPNEYPFACRPGSPCYTVGVCRRGQVSCTMANVPVCLDAGALPAGTPCGVNQVCNSAGMCVSCDEGSVCSTGNACQLGRVSCATGSAVCTVESNRVAGTVCGFGTGNYTRDLSPFGWFDACNAPGAEVLLPSNTDGTASVTLPFGFRYYGTTYTSAGISVNGMLGFPSVNNQWVNSSIPAMGMGDAIMPFWDDLQTRSTGICRATLGDAPERIHIIQWANLDIQNRGSSGIIGASLNFEVVLEEATQAFSMIYGAMSGDARVSGSSATIGIQRANGTQYDQLSYNTAGAVTPSDAIRWVPPASAICDGNGMCRNCTTSETCNGLDDNCNALVDDGIPDISCGVGACRVTVPGCVRGAVPTCTPGAPTTEVCNGVDDNCNTIVDDNCVGQIYCPSDRTMFAGDSISLTATTMGTITNRSWSIVSGPTGGAAVARWSPNPPTSLTESFTPIIVGVYRIRVSGRDGFGGTQSCEFNVTALPRGLRVELTWDGTGDVDLHLHNSDNTRWFNGDDCFYSNMHTDFNAWLDVDNVVSDGPENIRIDSPPTTGVYTIGIHNYARGAGRVATVKVYCGTTGGITPNAVYTSTALAGNDVGNCTNNTFWKVARVAFRADGGCDLTPINTYSTSNARCMAF